MAQQGPAAKRKLSMRLLTKVLILISLFLFISCDLLSPPNEGCCMSWNDGDSWPSIDNPICIEDMTFDDCKSLNWDYNGSYAAGEESCAEASTLCQ
tara:strand:+ start:957 stop:1244 length:288 start_codon:yes stop_codon:yes gene_type:complete